MSEVETGPGFVANYPPFAHWTEDATSEVQAVLDAAPRPGTPLGAYVHVPFCRKRCRFCYFKVYTEKPAAELRRYVDGVLAEARLYAARPLVGGRLLDFLYVGGGTPSYLSSDQIDGLLGGLRAALPWSAGAELTYECEPGTVRAQKIAVLVEHGVSRVSLGVEAWDDHVLEVNGRAHTSAQVEPAYRICRDAGVPQINLDLIAGMVGETEQSWRESVARTLALEPDSVTIYQLEIPTNTELFRTLKQGGELGGAVADVATRRRWAREAFETLQRAGYTMTSGYTAVRGDPTGRFVYRDSLWHGADMIPLGVSAFGQLSGVHLQNDKHLGAWQDRVESGRLPLQRALRMSADEQLVREWILQLKLGHVEPAYFRDKFGVDPLERFEAPLRQLARHGLVDVDPAGVTLSWDALLQVDRLLPVFFAPEHGGPAPGMEVALGQ
ncbi:MAG: coproporphyrinogen III oxidase family protein [Alphaproteobacteria bacterium]|nr:coproporphyrinogen III oxidase family protein [Alphaproteobacteria bacterium]